MSWKHDYDDYFNGLGMDERELHYYADETMNSFHVNFFVQNDRSESAGSINFYVYREEQPKYEQRNAAIENLFSSQNLLITPIEVLEQALAEQKRNKQNAVKQIEEEGDLRIIQAQKAEQVRDRQLWVDKYMPKRFDELLSHDKANREVLCWLKSWDPIVFKKKLNIKKLSTPYYNNNNNNSFGKNMFGKPFVSNQQYPQGGQGQPFVQQRPFFFDLEDEYSVTKMQNSVVLLAGPPGSGKTTLARTIASHCGYKTIEINASEDRTASKLIDRIEMLTRNEALSFKTDKDAPKDIPSLIIVDEVDGALESESQGAVNLLLDFIFKGEKNAYWKSGSGQTTGGNGGKGRNLKKEGNQKSKKGKENNEDEDGEGDDEGGIEETVEETKTSSSQQTVHIRRPVIFICNDVYSKGLRELRKKALVFHFMKARSEKLLLRLKEICQKEKLYIDLPGLTKICDHNENDIRSTLMNLQMISKLQRQSTKSRISIDQILIEEQHNSKSVIELLEKVLMIPSFRNEPAMEQFFQFKHLMEGNNSFISILKILFNNYPSRQIQKFFRLILFVLHPHTLYPDILNKTTIK